VDCSAGGETPRIFLMLGPALCISALRRLAFHRQLFTDDKLPEKNRFGIPFLGYLVEVREEKLESRRSY
jgi:hypothetical protein